MGSVYTAPTIDFEETTDPKSPIESNSDGEQFVATRTLECAWSDRLTLMEELLTAYDVTISGRVFVFGDKYPHRNRVFCKGIERIEGFGSPGGSGSNASWSKARITARYEEAEFDPDGNFSSGGNDLQVFEEDFDFQTEQIVVPSSLKLFWPDGDVVEDVDAPLRQFSVMRWSLSFTEKTTLPASFRSSINKVNSDTVTSQTNGFTFDPETLLYIGPRIRRTIFASGDVVNNVTLNFAHKPDGGWNKFFQPGEQDAQEIYIDKNANTRFKPFKTTGFSGAFGI